MWSDRFLMIAFMVCICIPVNRNVPYGYSKNSRLTVPKFRHYQLNLIIFAAAKSSNQ